MRGNTVTRLWACSLVLLTGLIVFAPGGAWAVAQSTPQSEETLQTQVANQQATISALETQVSDLKTRVSEVSGSKKPGATTTSASSSTSTKPLAVGETYSNGIWEITVTGYEFAPTLDTTYQQNVARGVYCFVYITVVNVGDKPVPFPYRDMRLKTGEGRTYSVADDALFNLTYVALGAGASNDDLQPGLPYNTGVLFDIPPDAVGLILTSETAPDFQVKLEQS